MTDEAVQQPLYAEGWRADDPDRMRPGETVDEYTHRMLAECRALLPTKGTRP